MKTFWQSVVNIKAFNYKTINEICFEVWKACRVTNMFQGVEGIFFRNAYLWDQGGIYNLVFPVVLSGFFRAWSPWKFQIRNIHTVWSIPLKDYLTFGYDSYRMSLVLSLVHTNGYLGGENNRSLIRCLFTSYPLLIFT